MADSLFNRFGSRWKTAVLIVAAVIILASSFIVYNAVTGKPPGGEWIAAEKDNLAFIAGRQQAFTGEWCDLLEAMQARPFTVNASISGSLEEGNPGLAQRHLDMVRQVMERGTLNIKAEGDPLQGKSYADASLSVYGMQLLSARLFHAEDQTGLKVPRLFDYYLLFDTDRLGNAVRLFLPGYAGPDNLKFLFLYSSLTDSLFNYLEQNLKDEYIEITPVVSHDSPPGVDIADRRIAISLTAEESDVFFNGLFGKLYNDAAFKTLVEGLANTVAFMSDSSGVNEALRSITRLLPEFVADETRLHFPDGFEMVLFTDESNRVVKRNISFSAGNESCDSIALFNFESAGGKTGDGVMQASGSLKIGVQGNEDALTMDYDWEHSPDGEGTVDDFSVYAGVSEGNESVNHFKAAVKRAYRPDAETGGSSYDTDLVISLPLIDSALEVNLTEEINQNTENNYHVSNSRYDLKVYDQKIGLGDIHLLASVNLEVLLTEGTGIPEPDLEGSVNLSGIDRDEWRDVMDDIRENLSDYMDRFRFLIR